MKPPAPSPRPPSRLPRSLPQRQKQKNQDLSMSSPRVNEGRRRKEALRLFFELRDRKYVSIIDELFRLYQFEDIAKGIYRKYKLLPSGWKEELALAKEIGNPSLNWLDFRRVQWLTETTDNYPGCEKRLVFPERGAREEAERVVDEFIEHERVYFERLSVFMNSYVAEVEAIAQDKVGPLAKQALGLDKNQVEFIFGAGLSKVFNAADALLIVLETLTLVHATPRVPGGRPGLLAEMIIFSGRSLVNAYAPYNARYQVAKKVLEQKHMALAGRGGGQIQGGMMRHLNFSELWAEISQAKPLLKQLSIDSVLIQPIRRFPNYKLFFERLLKLLPASDPAYNKVQNALTQIQEFTREIDEEVRKNASIEGRFVAQLMGTN